MHQLMHADFSTKFFSKLLQFSLNYRYVYPRHDML